MRARLPLLVLAAAVLAGCQTLGLSSGGTGDAPAIASNVAQCPNIGTPSDTGDVVRFRTPDSRDLTDLVIAARITSLGGNCAFVNRQQAVEVTLAMGIEATRGPASTGRTVQIPYFVAVTKPNQEILDKAVYTLSAEFPANTQRVRMRGEEVRLTLPVTTEVPVASYHVYVGFQLTEPELALNRSRAGLR